MNGSQVESGDRFHPGRPEITRAPATALALGLLAGASSALLGIGAGLLMVPGMVYLLRIRRPRAIGTSLFALLPAALAAAYRYHQEALARQAAGIQPGAVLWLAAGSVLGAVLAARVTGAAPAKPRRQISGGLAILAGMLMIGLMHRLPRGAPGGMDLARGLETTGAGALAGFFSGLLGMGGGLEMVPVLVLLLGYPQHLAQGTSLAVLIPVSISGALIHLRRGNVVWSLAGWLTAGAVAAAWVVAGKVFQVSQADLQMLFGAFLIAVGVSMVGGRAGGSRE